MTPNGFAWAALLGWPAIVIAVYAARRAHATLARTTAWMMLLPVMFLPARFDLPFAALNKHRIAFLSIAVALYLFHRRELRANWRWLGFPAVVLVVFAFGSVQTVRANGDPLTFGPLVLPALGHRDAAWMVYGFFVDAYLPFVIGRIVFRTERDLRDLLEVLSLCAIVYTPLCLLEIRLSPQLSNWVYGYFPHSFLQARRGTGFRPVVFMNHGLSVGMFLFSGLSAALALHKARARTRPPPGLRGAAAAGVLLLSGNLAALVYSLVAVVLQLSSRGKAIGHVVLVIAAFVLAYPLLRASGAFPARDVAEAFGRIDPERQASLAYRFENEDALLERAMERPVFGWGGWGRSRIFISWGTRYDSWAGYKDVSVTDGAWIIMLGVFGFVGFAAFFALLVVPLVRFLRCQARIPASSRPLVGGLALIVALFTLDLLPNAQSDLLLLAYAGALFTLADRRRRPAATPAATRVDPPSREPAPGGGDRRPAASV